MRSKFYHYAKLWIESQNLLCANRWVYRIFQTDQKWDGALRLWGGALTIWGGALRLLGSALAIMGGAMKIWGGALRLLGSALTLFGWCIDTAHRMLH